MTFLSIASSSVRYSLMETGSLWLLSLRKKSISIGFACIVEEGSMRTLALFGAALGIALAAVLTAGAQAQDLYPSKPVRIVVSFAAGGPTDQVARIMSAKLTELTGQTFLVENKTGAGGNIGADVVAKAAPDGYTVLMATVSTHAINP